MLHDVPIYWSPEQIPSNDLPLSFSRIREWEREMIDTEAQTMVPETSLSDIKAPEQKKKKKRGKDKNMMQHKWSRTYCILQYYIQRFSAINSPLSAIRAETWESEWGIADSYVDRFGSLLVFSHWEKSVEWRGEKKERKNILCSEMCKESFPCSVIPSVTSFLLWDRHPGHKTLDPFHVQNSLNLYLSCPACYNISSLCVWQSIHAKSWFQWFCGRFMWSPWQWFVEMRPQRGDAIETSVSRRDGDGVYPKYDQKEHKHVWILKCWEAEIEWRDTTGYCVKSQASERRWSLLFCELPPGEEMDHCYCCDSRLSHVVHWMNLNSSSRSRRSEQWIIYSC